jgi:hypothetical protein
MIDFCQLQHRIDREPDHFREPQGTSKPSSDCESAKPKTSKTRKEVKKPRLEDSETETVSDVTEEVLQVEDVVPNAEPTEETHIENSAREVAVLEDNAEEIPQAAQDEVCVPVEPVTSSCPPEASSASDLAASPARQDSDVPAETHAPMLIEEQAPAQIEPEEVNRTLIFTPMPAPMGEIHASPQVR